eukprot:360089-Chlamydomonas_euryale.AAC.7
MERSTVPGDGAQHGARGWSAARCQGWSAARDGAQHGARGWSAVRCQGMKPGRRGSAVCAEHVACRNTMEWGVCEGIKPMHPSRRPHFVDLSCGGLRGSVT